MQKHESKPVVLFAAALNPARNSETRKLRASRLMTGDRLMLVKGDVVKTSREPYEFTVTETMFPAVHSIRTTSMSPRVFVNLMNGSGEILGQVSLRKKDLVTISCDRALLVAFDKLPDCITSIDFYFLPGSGRRWCTFNEDQKIGELWSDETGAWHCWALRDTNYMAFKNIDACLAYIAGVYKSRLRGDQQIRGAMLSILKD